VFADSFDTCVTPEKEDRSEEVTRGTPRDAARIVARPVPLPLPPPETMLELEVLPEHGLCCDNIEFVLGKEL
jgi:hypothetical protein